MITVIAHYRAHPDYVGQVRALLAGHARASASEAGCLQFLAFQDAEDPERFALYEAYEDRAAFAAHRRTTHFRVNIEETLVPMLAEREWRVYGAPIGVSDQRIQAGESISERRIGEPGADSGSGFP